MHPEQLSTSQHRGTVEHDQPAHTPPTRGSGAWLVGCLFFSAMVFAVILITGAQVLTFDGEPKRIPLLVWNVLITLGQVAICIGIWRRDSWARAWGLGTSMIQCVSTAYIVSTTRGLPNGALAFFVCCWSLAIIAFVMLRIAKPDFPTVPQVAAEDGGLLEQPRKLDPSVVITFVLILGSIVVQLISTLD